MKKQKVKKDKGRLIKNNVRGITLIALVITIVVLLILASVSIATLTGENGILTRLNEAKIETEEAKEDELRKLTALEATTNLVNMEYFDSKGNKAIIPAGFAVSQVEGENEIDTGLVIIDSEGNEFVWIPIGNISNGLEEKNIDLNRYTFAQNGTVTKQDSNIILNYYEELEESKDGNISAKNIKAFISSATKNGGYYIGRYEASYGEDGKPNSKISTGIPAPLESITLKEGMLWNWITQKEASVLCQNMYTSPYFTSDLINSYAWDTALVFIQKFSKSNNYSMQDGKSLNDTLNNTGKNGDSQLNINDMAGGILEYSTEYCSVKSTDYLAACTIRGGSYYYDKNYYSSTRKSWTQDTANDGLGFRAILYMN